MADLMQVITELTNERFFGAGAGQESSIGRKRVEGTKESEALDEFTYKRVHRDHTFGSIRNPENQDKGQCRDGATPGCVISRCTSGSCSAACSIAVLSSSIFGLSRSSSSSKSCRRRALHGANESDQVVLDPACSTILS